MNAHRRLRRMSNGIEHTTAAHPNGGGSRLIASSPCLASRLAVVLAIGGSPFGALFDRQTRTATGDRLSLGPPGRPELNMVDRPMLQVLNLAANSYLGLANDPRVRAAVAAAVARYGTHTGGSRLFCGTAQLHFELEQSLAKFFRAASVYTYSSGYVANLSVISALFGPGDAIILDRNAHRSIYDGALLSGATLLRFVHNDVGHLDAVLHRSRRFRRRLVAVDSVYSMEGHIAPLPEIIEVAHRHEAFVLADEAHAIGVLGAHGAGSVEHFGLDPTLIDIRTGTLSKAIPAVGGFVAAAADVVALLRYASHGALFSAALTPMDVAAAKAAIDILASEPERVARVRDNARLLRGELEQRGWDTIGSETAIVPVRVGERMMTLEAALRLLDRGVYVNPVISPGVPEGAERLRCFVTAGHAAGDLQSAADAIHETLTSLGHEPVRAARACSGAGG
jgi:8-amino-7-oxononanoate synthase